MGYGLPWTGETTSYVNGDDGSYQTGYTLDRPILKGAESKRFVDNGDGTISDKATGLMWVKDPNSFGAPWNVGMNWNDAIINCENLSFAGHDDWRLPNVIELMSILDYGMQENPANPAIDPYFFPSLYGGYWSSTTWSLLADITNSAWVVDSGFSGGGNVYTKDKGGASPYPNVRPVRGIPIGTTETKIPYLALGIGVAALAAILLIKK